MPIKYRLILSHSTILVFMLVMLVFTGLRFNSTASQVRDIVEGDVLRAELAGEINIQAESVAGRLLLLFILEDQQQRTAVYKEIDIKNKQIDDALKKIQILLVSEQDKRSLQTLMTVRKAYHEQFFATVDEIEFGGPDEARKLMTGKTMDALNALLAEVSIFKQHQQQSMNDRQASILTMTERALLIMMMLGGGALLIGVLMTYKIITSITLPLNQSVSTVSAIADGDLSLPIPEGSNNELGRLLSGMSHMQEQLKEMISEIDHDAKSVHQSATEILAQTGDMKASLTKQWQMSDNINSRIYSLSQGINQTSTDVKQIELQAVKTQALSEQGVAAITQATYAIKEIAVSVCESSASVARLSESALEVTKAITHIREIADQTNLLALNASIEAARAGESGRGFAVVADEVRALAKRTAEVTLNIDDVIGTMKKQTNQVEAEISQSEQSIERGVLLIEEIIKPLQDMQQEAAQSRQSLQSLAELTIEQALQSDAVASNATEIMDIAQINQRASDSLAIKSDALLATAQRVDKALAIFKLEAK
ncbi:methyl-accepting chemotaxis protein [Psychromonas sp. Urea-02u-13]|uniref:methyl-accepting chemotaxis protein n=1 Tax=Psychromonas sp. Urea-02u-13 TaxID=2058326 RepID=UPI000C3382E2|nr:methyl-accepting chemotaxis protein [Psychromonas sp. Urea-02u-13]PKG39153.1 hypothetical protein CXF74_09610 [Psychromonas sp. Urea-02u-13]